VNRSNNQTVFRKKAYTGVRQDKYPPERITAAAEQPVTTILLERTRPVSTAATHSHKAFPADNRPKHHGSEKRQTLQIASRVAPHIKSEVVRVAKRKGWTESKTVACLVEQALAHNLAEEFAVTLKNTLEHAITKQMANATNRTANLALESFYSAEESRIVGVYLLRFLLGEEREILPQIIKDCQEQARENVERVLHEGKAGREHN
jgi:hypothetical protein